MSDADGSWPADPLDPRCPHCGGPVSATADYCMHCEEDLPTGDARAADPYGAATTEATAWTTPSAADLADRDWFHPDGFLDDSLTLLVGVVAGVIAGTLATFAVVWALPAAWPFLVGGVAWLGVTVAVARNRTVFDAAEVAGYLLALVLVALPLTVSATAPMADPGESRLGLAVVLAVFAWPVAAVLAGVGRILGGFGAEDDEAA